MKQFSYRNTGRLFKKEKRDIRSYTYKLSKHIYTTAKGKSTHIL